MTGSAARGTLILVAFLIATSGVACNDSTNPLNRSGSLVVSAPTTGNGIPTSYGTVTVDDTAPRPLRLNGAVTYAALSVGNHALAFSGLQAPNCSMTDSIPVIVTVQPSATAHVAFHTQCFGIGSIEVTTTTTGVDLPDGYTVSITSDSLGGWGYSPLPANGATSFAGAREGTYSVSLNVLAPNCTAAPSNPTAVTVVNGQTTSLALAVSCVAFGAIQVTATTSGADLDPDGYSAAADLAVGGGIAVPVNGSATFTRVGPGTQNVTLSSSTIAVNCAVGGANPVSVTVASGATAQVQFAVNCASVLPAGSALAFTSLRNGNAEIYVLRAGASFTAVNLTNSAAADSAPEWSHDGLELAFITSRDLDDEIYKMSADGSAPLNLTRRAGSDLQPAWAPGGRKVAFVSTRNDQGDSVPAEIFVMAPDGSGTRTALTANSGGSGSPAWSPDGTKIAFVTVRDGNAEVYAMNADGSAPVDLTHDAGADDHPVWSPDGTRLAFVSNRSGRSVLYVMHADGTAVTRVAPSTSDTASVADDDVSWSPDGTRLAVAAGGIMVVNADGSGATRLVTDVPTHCVRTRGGLACSSLSATTPAWSPDGTRIVYHRTNRLCRAAAPCQPANPQSAILLMNPDGTSPVQLTSEAGIGAIRPVWKP